MLKNTYKMRALGVVMIGTFMAILDSSIVNVAMPHMMASFGTNLDKMKWVATAYMIAYGVVVLASNYLGKKLGQEKLYVYALILFTLGSLMCGRAWNINSIIAFRAFQAIGGGLMLPTGMTIITRVFEPRERGTAFGFFGLVIVLAPVLGPTLGGYLVDNLNWQWIFLVNIPVGIMGVLVALSVLKFEAPEAAGSFDWVGFLGLGSALSAMSIALSQGERLGWSSGPIVACFTISAIGIAAFLLWDLHSRNPILDLSLFSNITFTVICVMLFLRAVSLFGRTLFLTLFMQTLMGYTALAAGVLLTPGAIMAGISAPIFGWLSDRLAAKPFIIIGSLLTAWSMWLYRDLSVGAAYSTIFWPMLIFGVGMGMVNSPLMSSAMNTVLPRQIGMVSIMQTVLMQVGGAYGINYIEATIDARQIYHLSHTVEAYTNSLHNPGGHLLPTASTALPHGPAALRQVMIALYSQQTSLAWAYNDAFIILTVLSVAIAVIALLFFRNVPLKRGHPDQEPVVEAEALEVA